MPHVKIPRHSPRFPDRVPKNRHSTKVPIPSDATPALRLALEKNRRQYREPEWVPNLYQSLTPKGRRRGKFFYERKSGTKTHRRGLGKSFDASTESAIQLNGDMDRGKRPVSAKVKRTTVTGYFNKVVEDKSSKSPKTLAAYRNKTATFERYLGEMHPSLILLSHVTPEIARQYLTWRERQTITRNGKDAEATPRTQPARRTIKDDLTLLRGIFQQACDLGLIPSNPFQRSIRVVVKSGQEVRKPHPLSESEAKRLLAQAAKYDAEQGQPGRPSTFRGSMADMILLYLHTGLRKMELISLPWKHVNLGEHDERPHLRIEPVRENVSLTVKLGPEAERKVGELIARRGESQPLFASRAVVREVLGRGYAKYHADAMLQLRASAWNPEAQTLTAESVIRWKPKASSGKVWLTKAATRTLRRQRKLVGGESKFVFPHPDGGPLKSDFWAEFKGVVRDAGLAEKIKVHDLRHTFGFTMRAKGVPLETLQLLMRHANLKETLLYATPSEDEAAKAISRLEGFAE